MKMKMAWGSRLPSESGINRPLRTGRQQLIRMIARAIIRLKRSGIDTSPSNPVIEDIIDDICEHTKLTAIRRAADTIYKTPGKKSRFFKDLRSEIARLT